MATYSSIFAWKISWTEEPGGLQSMGLQRVGTRQSTHTVRVTNDSRSSGRIMWEQWIVCSGCYTVVFSIFFSIKLFA